MRTIAATIDHGNDDLSGEDSLADTETDSVLRVTIIIVQVEVVVTRVMSSVGLESMIIYRMVIVEGHCTQLTSSSLQQISYIYIYNRWLTQKYSEF